MALVTQRSLSVVLVVARLVRSSINKVLPRSLLNLVESVAAAARVDVVGRQGLGRCGWAAGHGQMWLGGGAWGGTPNSVAGLQG